MHSNMLGLQLLLKAAPTCMMLNQKCTPLTYVSQISQGSQLRGAILTKEACATYMAVKKATLYCEDADIIVQSDHSPLKKFLLTLNTKVNDWDIKLSTYHISFDLIELRKPDPQAMNSGIISLYLTRCHNITARCLYH